MVFLESQARNEAEKEVVVALNESRGIVLNALRSQNSIVQQHGAMAIEIAEERQRHVERAEALEKKMQLKVEEERCAAEALTEYRAASIEWLHENDAVGRELRRVRQGYDELRDVVESSSLAAGSVVRQRSVTGGSPNAAFASEPRQFSPSPLGVAAAASPSRASVVSGGSPRYVGSASRLGASSSRNSTTTYY